MTEFVELKASELKILVKPFNSLTTEHILPLLNEPDNMRQFAMTQNLLRDLVAVDVRQQFDELPFPEMVSLVTQWVAAGVDRG